ncbi:DUF6233 domain-containing protein [Streptomyces sp. NBC_00299]|uniref:DUF6233 domain-containing protein n=1 Tax=Streptomyces sp. NBC_00299 TaxID=2975705 RepID=UPI002E2A1417|nr:DUF6233 domain-containing protein [Streptomyces sp. NBC_00299]
MFDDLPPDLERLRTLRVWHALWMERIDRKIADLQRRQAEEERGRRNRPQPPDWIVELGIGAERAPVQVHAGDCYMAGKRRRPVNRDEARRLLATGLRACNHCQPDIQLHMLDLATQAAPRRCRAGSQHGQARHDRRQHRATQFASRDADTPTTPHDGADLRGFRDDLPRGSRIGSRKRHLFTAPSVSHWTGRSPVVKRGICTTYAAT